MSTPDLPLENASSPATATIVYPGAANRPSIELRTLPDGSNEAYLIPNGAVPIPSGVSLIEEKGKYFLNCLIRKKRLAFKPEEVVRQMVLVRLLGEYGYEEDQIQVEVGVQMGSAIHAKPAD